MAEDRRACRAGKTDSIEYGDASRSAGFNVALHLQSRIDGTNDAGTKQRTIAGDGRRAAKKVRFTSEGAMHGAVIFFFYCTFVIHI